VLRVVWGRVAAIVLDRFVAGEKNDGRGPRRSRTGASREAQRAGWRQQATVPAEVSRALDCHGAQRA